MRSTILVCVVATAVVVLSCATVTNAAAASDLEIELRVLSKQVTTLMERRRDDLKLIEEDLAKKLANSQEINDMRKEIQDLR